MTQSATPAKAPPALGPYSQGVKAAGLLFITGQLGLDPETGKLVEGGTREQAAQCLRNIAAIAAENGTSLSRAVKTTVMIKDLKQFGTVNELYKETFSTPYPARASFEAAALPLGALIEIDAVIAY